jgi:hypothetical protein
MIAVSVDARRRILAVVACAALAAAVLVQLTSTPPLSTATKCPPGEAKNERTAVCAPTPPSAPRPSG